jgi:D-alanine--poly(phosphoribitol) ligase subunit 2
VDLRTRIRTFIAGELLADRPGGTLADGDDLLLSGLLDSLSVVRLVAFLETDLGVAVPPEDVTLEHFQSIEAIAGYLEGRRHG